MLNQVLMSKYFCILLFLVGKNLNSVIQFSIFIPVLYKKKASVIMHSPMSVMLSPKSLDEIQSNLVCELLT